MSDINRRYDIDWLRVIAIALLLIYHVAIGFQSWGIMIGFITNNDPWPSLWLPMAMLNVWRIPLLFFVSGMGVYFAMQHRTWKQLVQERSLRILLPYLFGMVAVFPLSSFILQRYYQWQPDYSIHPGHLWFLGNIFAYVVILLPLLYLLKKHRDGTFVSRLRKLMRTPLGLLPFLAVFMVEALVLQPYPYELYAFTWHGFVLGLLAFLSGFLFVLCGEPFWKMIVSWRWLFLIVALGLFVVRSFELGLKNPVYLLVLESDCWIFSVLAFGHRYLNRPGKVLDYLSEAAYPVYILHMIFLFLGSSLIFPLDISVGLKFATLLAFTFAGCFGAFEIVRRISVLRPLFGMKMSKRKATTKNSRELARA